MGDLLLYPYISSKCESDIPISIYSTIMNHERSIIVPLHSLPIFSLPFCSLLNRFSPMIVAFYKLFHILPRITTMTGRCRMSFCLHLPSYVFNYRLGMFHFAADSLSLSLLTTKNNNMSNQKDCDKRVCLS